MSMLTKVLSVLVVVMSIFFCGLVVAHFSQAPDWRQLATQAKTLAAQVTAESDQVKLEARARLAELTLALGRANSKLDEANRDLQKAQRAKADLALERDNGAKAMERMEIERTQLTGEKAEQSKLLALQTERNSALQRENSELHRVNLDLSESVKVLRTSVETLEAKLNVMTQQQAARDQTIEQLQAKLESKGLPTQPVSFELAGLDLVTPRSPVLAGPVRAAVTEVSGNVAGVSVGRASGVLPGKRFTVYRTEGDSIRFLGTLVVREVAQEQAVGVLADLKDSVRPGDQVTDVVQ